MATMVTRVLIMTNVNGWMVGWCQTHTISGEVLPLYLLDTAQAHVLWRSNNDLLAKQFASFYSLKYGQTANDETQHVRIAKSGVSSHRDSLRYHDAHQSDSDNRKKITYASNQSNDTHQVPLAGSVIIWILAVKKLSEMGE